jgi:hypothetical protein
MKGRYRGEKGELGNKGVLVADVVVRVLYRRENRSEYKKEVSNAKAT